LDKKILNNTTQSVLLLKNIYTSIFNTVNLVDTSVNNIINNLINSYIKINLSNVFKEDEFDSETIDANILNISIADLQHGVFSDEGYYGKKYRDCCNQLGWPNHILCWDVESKEWLDKNIGKYVESMVIGNPWINRFIVKEKRDQLVNNEFNKFIRKFDNRPAILVSLQYGEDIDNLNFIGIPNGLFEYFKKNGSRFNWFFRIHPIVLNSKSFTEIDENFKSLFFS
jgi:hypothetical protein